MITNAKYIMDIEKVQELIMAKFCELYIASYQKLKIFQILMLKLTKFIGELEVDIEKLLCNAIVTRPYNHKVIYDLGIRPYIFKIKHNLGI